MPCHYILKSTILGGLPERRLEKLLICDLYIVQFEYSLTKFLLVSTDVTEIFEIVRESIAGTNSEQFFLSILQHLLCIRDDEWVK